MNTHLTSIKTEFLATVGVAGGFVASLLGGWDTALQTLLVFMLIDIVTGWAVAITGKSPKTTTGGLYSQANFIGLVKKGVMLMLVWMATQLDIATGLDFIRAGVVLSFAFNEGLSITENAGLLGVPLPRQLTEALELLKKQKGE